MTDENGVLVALARLEGKVDAALAHQGAVQAEHGRRLDDTESELRGDVQPRLRAVEARPVVSPRAMWMGVGTVAGIVAALAPFVERLYS